MAAGTDGRFGCRVMKCVSRGNTGLGKALCNECGRMFDASELLWFFTSWSQLALCHACFFRAAELWHPDKPASYPSTPWNPSMPAEELAKLDASLELPYD